MVDVFRKGKIELFSLNETKLKGNGEVWCGAMVSLPMFIRLKCVVKV